MTKITVGFVFVLMVAALETLNAQNYYDAGDVDFVDYGPAPPPRAPPANSRSKFEIKIGRIIFSEFFDSFRDSTDFERRPLVSKTNFPTCTAELFCEPTPVQFLQLVLNKCITYFLWKWGPLFSKYICGVNIFCIFLNSFFFQKLHFTQSKNW